MSKTIIVAATMDQARLVADKLDLKPSEWKMATSVSDILGVSVDNIVVALPNLVLSQGHDVGLELMATEKKQGKRAREVWT